MILGLLLYYQVHRVQVVAHHQVYPAHHLAHLQVLVVVDLPVRAVRLRVVVQALGHQAVPVQVPQAHDLVVRLQARHLQAAAAHRVRLVLVRVGQAHHLLPQVQVVVHGVAVPVLLRVQAHSHRVVPVQVAAAVQVLRVVRGLLLVAVHHPVLYSQVQVRVHPVVPQVVVCLRQVVLHLIFVLITMMILLGITETLQTQAYGLKLMPLISWTFSPTNFIMIILEQFWHWLM